MVNNVDETVSGQYWQSPLRQINITQITSECRTNSMSVMFHDFENNDSVHH